MVSDRTVMFYHRHDVHDLSATRRVGAEETNSVVCVFVCFLPIHSRLQWTYQPGSHRKKVTQDLPSTFFLRCLP